MMKLHRRRLLQTALGAGQLALLANAGLLSSSKLRAQAANPALPSRLLTVWLDGGCHWETLFSPFTQAGIEKYIPEPRGGNIPLGYFPAQVERFDRQSFDINEPGPVRALRGPIYWDWNNPSATSGEVPNSGGGQQFRPAGYAFADPTYKLFDKTCVLVGADQGTASHQSGVVASMCGVAGSAFRAPSVQAVISNALAARFPDRPLLNVNLGGTLPSALGLPSLASPTSMSSLSSVEPTLSDRRGGAWKGLRARTATPDLAFDGTARDGTVARTAIDDVVAASTRELRGKSNSGSDRLLESLYDSYKTHSSTIAKDVLTSLSATPSFEFLANDPLYAGNTTCIGYADVCGGFNSTAPWAFALQLLKSDLVTSVNLRATSIANSSFDTHSSNGPQMHTNHLRIAFEGIGRMLLEMELTQLGNGKTLLDDTLVYIYSDFGRTFPKQGSDHHPATCAVLVGGGVVGNQMLGGYDETMDGSPLGMPVDLINEDGHHEVRMPKSQDVAATVIRAFGLEPGRDFFIPGGFGVFDGALRV
jgi:hypothetical protein